MSEPSPDKGFLNAIGPWIIGAVGAVVGWLPGGLNGAMGSALMSLVAFVGCLCGVIFPLIYKRYLGILGASGKRKGTSERDGYDQLRESLSGGNRAAREYAKRLTKFLDAVDRFFGDAGKADQTLFPHAFGLKTPAPLWTAPAFDCCLLLALVYPIVTILLIWAASGQVGPAEAALGLQPDMAGWRRGILVGAMGISSLACWLALSTSKFVAWLYLAISMAVGAVVLVVGIGAPFVAVAFVFAFVLAVVAAGERTGAYLLAFTVAVVVAVAIVPLTVGLGLDTAGLDVHAIARIGIFALPFVFAVAVIYLYTLADRHQRRGLFLSLYLFGMIIICLGVAMLLPYFMSSMLLPYFMSWRVTGSLLLVLGLLTLINAPFDWASLGLTRALLRRGLELGGWWPYLLALVDALAAAVIIALLAITMVIGVQTFDNLAEHAGGADARVLPLDKLFDGIAAQPLAPEYWWVYALLLSTMIPSLLNLMIGGTSLLRGIPWLPAFLLQFMPASKAVATFDRTWLALVLTIQFSRARFSASRLRHS